jgi:hypothetical protein
VAVFFSPTALTFPTMLIKMQPWTPEEVAQVSAFLAPPEMDVRNRPVLVENPLDASQSFLSQDFYSGDFPRALSNRLAVDFTPCTDDKPYFAHMRRHLRTLQADPQNFLDPGTAYWLNLSLIRGVPMDQIHLYVTGAASALFVLLFVFMPLKFSKVGRREGGAALPLLTYFSCLGAGFITLELVFIQKFMHLIGSPLYTYSTVIFTMLLGAGIGSAGSEKLGIECRRKWGWPFLGVIGWGLALVLFYPLISHTALALPVAGRIVVSGVMILPLGFFLGMPFPLGILAIANRPRGAIAWAWGMNGLFTVVGGLLSVVVSVLFGFNFAILMALGLYVIALAVFRDMRDTVSEPAAVRQAVTPPEPASP